MGNFVESPDEAQQARVDALREFIASRLGEHDAARNVEEGPSGEQITVLATEWSVDALAEFIVDDLDYELLAPVFTLDPGAERIQVRTALAAVDAVITKNQPRELRKETLAEDVELIIAGRQQAREACEDIATERDKAIADLETHRGISASWSREHAMVCAQRDRAKNELAALRARIVEVCDHPDFRLGRGLLKVTTVRSQLEADHG